MDDYGSLSVIFSPMVNQGQTIRISLDWDIEESNAPDAVLVKFPTDNVGNRGLAEAEGSYDREFDFYERFSGDLPIAVPQLVHAVRDHHAGEHGQAVRRIAE